MRAHDSESLPEDIIRSIREANLSKVLLVSSFEKDKLITRALRPSLPVNMMVLAAELKNNDIDCDLFDLRIQGHDDLKSLLERNDYACVGLSILTGSCITKALELARIIRGRKPELPLVWGGVHPTLEPMSTAMHPLVDIVVHGEGEETFPELVKAMIEKKPLDPIGGIYYKNGKGTITKTNDRKPFDINRSAEPDFDLLTGHDYDFSTFDYEASRGCPFRCMFCDVLATHRNKWKPKASEKVIRDIQKAVAAFQPEYIHFIDDNFFVNKKRALEIANGLAPLKVKWYASCRSDLFSRFDDGYLRAIRDSGCFKIMMGVESASQRILDVISKGIKVEDIEESARKAHQYDIQLVLTFMLGLPEETEEDVAETIDFILSLTGKYDNVVASGIYYYSPYPATPLFHKAVEMGFHPPATLEEWGKFELSRHENIPWHSVDYLEKLKPLALMSRLGIVQVRFWENVMKQFLSGNVDRALANLLRMWFRARMRYHFYRFPADIYLFDQIRRKIFPNS